MAAAAIVKVSTQTGTSINRLRNTEGRRRRGNPLVNQRDNAKDQDRKTTKAPSCGALVLLLLFQQPGAGPLFPQLIARVAQRAVAP
jgi:hypothetical protein